jgi:opacity protein-like surface antigen
MKMNLALFIRNCRRGLIKIGKVHTLIVIALLCVIPATNSSAADNGSLYFRTGIGTANSGDATFFDVDCHSVSPAALFGCIPGNDGRPIGAYGDFGKAVALDVGVGYRWNEWFRSEVFFSYRPDFRFDGLSNFAQLEPAIHQGVRADAESTSLMVAGIVRPTSLFGAGKWSVDPFVMAGMGMARNRIDSMVFTFPDTQTVTPNGSYSGFAWTVGGGFSYALGKNVELEIVYRYVDLGEVKTDVGTMNILNRSTGEIINDAITINGTKADLTTHEALLSIVWFF